MKELDVKRQLHRVKRASKRRSIQLIISLSFTIVSILSMAFMTFAFYTNYINTAKATAIENNKQVIEQISWNLNSYLKNMMRISDSMYYNVIKDLDLTSDTMNNEMDLLYEANKDNLISIACISQDGALISAAPIATRKAGVDFTDQAWFYSTEERIENFHFSTPHVQNMFESSNYRYYWVVSLSRSIDLNYMGYNRRGILLVDMNYSAIEQMFSRVNEGGTGYVYLIDSEGEIIYHPKQKAIYTGLVNENNTLAATYEDGNHIERFEGKERSIIVKTVGYTGWKIVSVVPIKDLAAPYNQLRAFMLIIITVTIFLIVFGNIFISKIVTDPIRRLEDSLNYIEDGKFDESNIYIGGSHEIRHLGRTIKSLVGQMHKLMDERVKEQKEKRKSELNALQAQINPHFLYNTLDSVIWMIEAEKYPEAISMIKSLASLFRISLSKGNNIITIKDEITHARNYLAIQKVRYKNRFEANIDIDPEIENCVTIKLIIQPLIENAIYHAVGEMEDDGLIDIKGYQKDGDIYIEVIDNGMGIPQEVLDNLLTEKTESKGKGSGIGLWNINQRINLYFKEDYGLAMYSELDEGTRAVIRLPKLTMEEYLGGEGNEK
ncbi:two-component system, sensor histidine kinase YesM [Pseudobutyrivibrio sp. UC1225]|uniref:sensor histidine kinase n=1 Tax=Pseudobutyrivibrio sp. UC1225 TaxID=1798185 RepID=UPI0008EC9203|nr:sensor histidine kinase [Pseudobutyrivibrio sp. UC1225]SFN40136.1 two-component system, sensor histidine kinase YesM [Pseudobutyrivibrio sp. UC1225]